MTHRRNHKPIVVGIDGTEDGLRALEFAAREAKEQGGSIRLVHAYHVSAALNPMLPLYGVESLRETGERVVNAAEQRLHDLAPDVPAQRLLAAGSAAATLVETSKTASMVVVGRRSLRGVSRLLRGSTSTAVAARAHCPVGSVPATWTMKQVRHQIVVGVDGSTYGHDALAYAFEWASWHQATLMAVRSWEVPSRWYTDIPELGSEATEWLERIQLGLAEDLAGFSQQFPDVPVVRVFERSTPPAEALVRRSEDASLLFVGARGHGGVPGLDLGWTTRSALCHAVCPVIVVHHVDHLGHEGLASSQTAPNHSQMR